MEKNNGERKGAKRNSIEVVFERFLWSSRFLVMLAVLSSLVMAAVLFVLGTIDVVNVVMLMWDVYANGHSGTDIHVEQISRIMGAVDIYLIAVVLLLFCFGLYEMFISEIDPAKNSEASSILEIDSLDSLKDKLAKVILMALIVKFFQIVIGSKFASVIDMLYLAGSICVIALSLYLLHLTNKKRPC